MFKFALDTEITPGAFLYGGSNRNDEKAMKAANHELKGLECYWSLSDPEMAKGKPGQTKNAVPKLRFTLLSLIKYRGYCLTAMFLV